MLKDHYISIIMRSASLLLHRQTNIHLMPFGITADQFVCLVILADDDGMTQQEMVQRCPSDPNTIREMLVRLEKRGLVSREKHPTDGRARYVTITTEGREILNKLVKAVKPIHKRLEELLDENEVQNLTVTLNRITEEMAKKQNKKSKNQLESESLNIRNKSFFV